MIRFRTFSTLILLALILPAAVPAPAPAAEPTAPSGPWAAAWKSVDDAIAQGQPQTALERLQPVIEGALRDRAWGEAAQAIGRRITLETRIQGNQPEERVTRFINALREAPAPIQPVFHALTAHAYWAYFQQNRWRIQERTTTTTTTTDAGTRDDGGDFRTWDLRRLFAAIDQHFSLALTNATLLQQTPIAEFDALLVPGTVPDRRRPTLFDFLAHEALAFYATGEQAGARPEDAFVLDADSPVFDPPEAFLAWTPNAPNNSDAAVLRAIATFQALLRFHRADPDPSAFLDADLARIRFAANTATGPTRDDRDLAALRAFVERAGDDDLAASARQDWASALRDRGLLTEAYAVATEAVRRFPRSPGAGHCRNLIAAIGQREVRLETERIWNAPFPPVTVHYRNIQNVWFRAVAVDWDQFLDRRQPRPDNLNPRQRLEILRRPATREWSASLAPTPDFKEARVEVPSPETLPPGFYFIFASHRPDFSEEDNVLSVTQVWVSDLALVVRPRAGLLEGFILDATSGEPVQGAAVDAWYLGNDGNRVAVPAQATDALGFFSFRRDTANRAYLLRARKGTREVALDRDFWWSPRPPAAAPGMQTLFFTDRALYRPGQLVQYKGICIRHEGTDPTYQLLPGRNLTVVFLDPNGKEIARQQHRANDYGSFSGTFTAPRDRLTGSATLRVEGEPAGATQVTIEEYKRPKFQVTLAAPKVAPRLTAPTTVTGQALAYTGAAIDAAKVTWRVTRRVRLPPWFRWFHSGPFPNTEAQEIAHGTATTATDGSFSLEFKALPDPAVPESNEPTFDFAIHADVTDSAGETRSAERTVSIGYTALAAVLAADEWQVRGQPVPIVTTTRTLDGEPQSAEGTLRIHRLTPPARIARGPLAEQHAGPRDPDPGSDPNRWPVGELVTEQPFATGVAGTVTNQFALEPGLYRATLETRDRFGKAVTAKLPIRVLDPAAAKLGLALPQVVAAPAWKVEPEQEFRALWGTGYETGRAFIEIEHRDRLIQRFWTEPGRTQQEIRHRVTEAFRGGFTLHVTQVRENRAYLVSREITVPWNNQELDLRWETFRSKLEPGARETWTAIIKPRIPGRPASPAELAATLYDASLDQFLPHGWPAAFDFWPRHTSSANAHFANQASSFVAFRRGWKQDFENVQERYRSFPPDLVNPRGRGRFLRGEPMMAFSADSSPVSLGMAVSTSAGGGAVEMAGRSVAVASGAAKSFSREENRGGPTQPAPATATTTAPTVVPRRNLQETAFFLPHVLTDSNGVARLTFTLPEALTEWRFLGFAHDRELRSGSLTGRTVTSKELMVQPNPPRFLREGDELEFTVKISNTSTNRLAGSARLEFTFAHDDTSADVALANSRPELPFEVPPTESRTLAWRIAVPDGCGFLKFKAVATTDRLGDGEEGWLPVLSRRVFLTESQPLPIRGPATNRFTFAALAESGGSRSLRHAGLTVEMVSQPAWYAVLALPYLMEYPHACTEQIFNRVYANSIAHHLATRDPKIRRVFDQWRATPALASPLEKNADLKSVALEETPWLRAAQDEATGRQQLGLLFESDRLTAELDRAFRELEERQLPEGGWSWFPGGPRDDYITLYIVSGFGRLRRLGVSPNLEPALRALASVDDAMTRRYEALREKNLLEEAHLDPAVALYLYARSLFAEPLPEPHKSAFGFWTSQARQHWLKLPRQSQAHLALAFERFGNRLPPDFLDLARTIVRSIKEHSVTDPELGRFWRDGELSMSWHRAPIETQALMIEAFAEVTGDAAAVDECQVWLLKQKQTQSWKSTKATADATYALLLRGRNLLASDTLASVELGGTPVRPASAAGTGTGTAPAIEPGTGFYQVRIPAAAVTPRLADITVRKTDAGVAWGAVHWQYLEDLDRVKPFTGTPLKLTKAHFIRTNTPAGPSLAPVHGPVQVGDELVVRIELRVDRDLEYVHLKDQRPSGTEPVQVLSGWRFQDGLGYYESTRDTASHFFIGYLPKGTYVFEYPVRVQHRGRYPAGIASIECLYAPEFNSHSNSPGLEVR